MTPPLAPPVVYASGTPVLVGGDVPAEVDAAIVRDGQVRYEVSWWDGASHHVRELAPRQFRADPETARVHTLGFHPVPAREDA